MTARWCLAMLWGALAATKALAPLQFITFIADSLAVDSTVARYLAWSWVGFEGLLSIALVIPALKSRRVAPVATALCVACVLLVGILTVGPAVTQTPCGCIGSLAEATYLRRLSLSGVLVFLAASALKSEVAAGERGARL